MSSSTVPSVPEFVALALQIGVDVVVGGRVTAHERESEKVGGVDGTFVVAGMEPSHDLLHAVGQDGVAIPDRYAELAPHVGLEAHDLVEAGKGSSFRMVGEKKVDGAPPPAQGFRQ